MAGLFPENAVEYFVSHYDCYQPEAYLPKRDLYIDKELSINERAEQERFAALFLLSQDPIALSYHPYRASMASTPLRLSYSISCQIQIEIKRAPVIS